MKLDAKLAANVGVLTAVSIVLTRFFGVIVPIAGANALRLSFGEAPIMLAGVLFGPEGGALAGVAADLVGFLINSFGGPYHPGLTLSMGLTGLIPGLLLHSKRNELTVLQVGLIVLLTDLITGVLLNTLWLSQMFGGGFFELLGMRLVARLLTVPLYTVTVYWASRAYRFYLAGGSR
jgi:ECF transporter S component (folate family)